MLKKILIGIGGLIAVILVLGALAPKEMELERAIVIAKPKAEVFEYLRYLKNTDNWSPWAKLDPNMVKELRGSQDGRIGAIYSWKGNKDVGSGEQEITGMIEGERIDLELRFFEPFKNTARSYYTITPEGEGSTKVVWGYMGKVSFPLNVICFLFNMKSMLGSDFEKGLTALKSTLESPAPTAAN